MASVRVIDTNTDNILELGVCSYKNIKTAGFPEKVRWLNDRFREGLKIKTLYSEKDGAQGMIEYLPGEHCWRPVEAKGYMFIHCLFVGFRSFYKGKGYATLLLNECIKDAQEEDKRGVAVVTRKGAFMAGGEIFLKNGFEVVDRAEPDFELLVKKYRKDAPDPKFKKNLEKIASDYGEGLTIIRADQCPYTVKNVMEICDTAKNIFGIKPAVIDLETCEEAQNSPCAFGTFCIVYNGKIIADHPISNTRFVNIMNKM
jgi:GNAT superfamily N-acetyltransferase